MTKDKKPLQPKLPRNRAFELPTKEHSQKEEFILSEGKVKKKYATNLEKYYYRGSLDIDQYNAGIRLNKDAILGGLFGPGLKGIDYSTFAVVSTTGYREAELSDMQIDRRTSFSNAMHNKEFGRIQRDVLWHVCVMDNDITSFNPASPHYSRVLLSETLHDLHRFYVGRLRQAFIR